MTIIRIISSHIDTVYKISNVGQFVQPYKQAKQTVLFITLKEKVYLIITEVLVSL